MSQLEDEIGVAQDPGERLFYHVLAFWQEHAPKDVTNWNAKDLEEFMRCDGVDRPIEEMCYQIAEANILAPDALYDEVLSGFILRGEDPYDPEFDEDGEALFVRQQQKLRQAATA